MTPAITEAEAAGIDFRIHEFRVETGTGYGRQAAERLGLPLERVFKTLVAKLDEARLVVAVIPMGRELDLKRLAATAGAKRAAMALPREAERATGYVLGGVSPLGQRQRLPTFVDESALRFATVFVSGGRRGLEIELSPSVLQAVCTARVAPIARGNPAP